MSTDSEGLEPGDRLGQFTIVAELDRGGFGVVYRALDADGIEVALKLLHPELAQDSETTRRFDREIRVVRLIAHPNVVRIIDVGATEDGIPYFAMELLAGSDLKQHIQRGGRLALAEMLKILEPLASALSASHRKGVIHRDLKPSNVFLADRVVLLDFGIAKLLEDTGTKITSSRHVVGTPPSMAPEQITGDPLDERTDVYALGALVFFMLTGRMPFVHDSIAHLLDLQLRAPAPLLSQYAPVSAALDKVIAASLAKEPEHRHASVAEFFEGVRGAIENGTDKPIELGETPAADRRGETAVAAHVELRPAGTSGRDSETGDFDEEALDRLEAALPVIAAAFEAEGFEVRSRAGVSVLVLHRGLTIAEVLTTAEGAIAAHRCAEFTIHVHVTEGGLESLPQVASWVPEASTPGIHVV